MHVNYSGLGWMWWNGSSCICYRIRLIFPTFVYLNAPAGQFIVTIGYSVSPVATASSETREFLETMNR